MSDFSEDQLKDFARRLAALEDSITELLDATESGTAPVNLKDNQGRLSRMDELHNQSILKANRTVLENRLRQTRAAKGRLRDGSFGYCLECGEMVTEARLQAYPDAALCITCQSEAERKS